MGLFEQFPYTNFHELNLDWLLDAVKKVSDTNEQVKKELEEFIITVDTKTKEEVQRIMQKWIDDGTITDILIPIIEEYAHGKIQIYADIADMQANFTQEIGVCYVLSDNSTYGAADQGNFFTYSEDMLFGEPVLYNGGCAKLVTKDFHPVKGGTGEENLPMIMRIAYSWANVPYASNSGPWLPGKSGIQCSQFVNAVLRGLLYENSNVNNADYNNMCQGGGCSIIKDENGDDLYPSASEMAHYAAAHGWLKKTHNYDGVEIGDVIFLRNGTEESTAVQWEGIYHCAMVVGRIGKSAMIVEASTASGGRYAPGSGSVKFYMIEDITKNDYVDNSGMYGYARFPMNYHTIKESYNVDLEQLTGSYTPESSVSGNVVIAEGTGHVGSWGVLKFNGYTAKDKQNTAVSMYCRTKAPTSSVSAAEKTVWDTNTVSTAGGIIPVLLSVDGREDTSGVKVALYVRQQMTVVADGYALTDINLKLYK